MTDSELLRAMGEYIREHGFSPRYNEPPYSECGCFIHAFRSVGMLPPSYAINIWGLLEPVVGTFFDDDSLAKGGWTYGATDDAYAACMIAADLAEP